MATQLLIRPSNSDERLILKAQTANEELVCSPLALLSVKLFNVSGIIQCVLIELETFLLYNNLSYINYIMWVV